MATVIAFTILLFTDLYRGLLLTSMMSRGEFLCLILILTPSALWVRVVQLTKTLATFPVKLSTLENLQQVAEGRSSKEISSTRLIPSITFAIAAGQMLRAGIIKSLALVEYALLQSLGLYRLV